MQSLNISCQIIPDSSNYKSILYDYMINVVNFHHHFAASYRLELQIVAPIISKLNNSTILTACRNVFVTLLIWFTMYQYYRCNGWNRFVLIGYSPEWRWTLHAIRFCRETACPQRRPLTYLTWFHFLQWPLWFHYQQVMDQLLRPQRGPQRWVSCSYLFLHSRWQNVGSWGHGSGCVGMHIVEVFSML